MIFTIIYSSHEEASRNFVAQNPEYPTVDWVNDEERETWIKETDFDEIRAFPAVVWKLSGPMQFVWHDLVNKFTTQYLYEYMVVNEVKSFDEVNQQKIWSDAVIAVTAYENNALTLEQVNEAINAAKALNIDTTSLDSRILPTASKAG